MQVRTAWYRCALSLCRSLPDSALDANCKSKSLGERLGGAALSRLEEKETGAVASAWDALLAFVGSFKVLYCFTYCTVVNGVFLV